MMPLAPAERTVDFFTRSCQQDELIASGRYLRIELYQGRTSGMTGLIDYHIKNDWMPKPDEPKFPDFDIYGDKIMNQAEVSGYPHSHPISLAKGQGLVGQAIFPVPNKSPIG